MNSDQDQNIVCGYITTYIIPSVLGCLWGFDTLMPYMKSVKANSIVEFLHICVITFLKKDDNQTEPLLQSVVVEDDSAKVPETTSDNITNESKTRKKTIKKHLHI
jgi:hypothetical protein